jgi:hypothetical protein
MQKLFRLKPKLKTMMMILKKTMMKMRTTAA